MPPLPELAFLAAVAAAAGFLRGFTGFGSSMVMAPIFSVVMAPASAIACVLALEGVITLQLLPKAARTADWRSMGVMAVAACFAIPLGTSILLGTDAEIMRRIIGAAVVFFAGLMFAGMSYRGSPRLWMTVGAGAASGFLSGATGMGGPPAILYLLAGKGSPEMNRANIIVFLGAVIFFTFGDLVLAGVVTSELLLLVAVLLPIFLAAGWCGTRLFLHGGRTNHRLWSLLTLILSGLVALLL
jgi:uncharacterized membrane protein YfcA